MLPLRQVITRESQSGEFSVDPVVPVDEEVAVRDGERPVDAVGASTSSVDTRLAASLSLIISELGGKPHWEHPRRRAMTPRSSRTLEHDSIPFQLRYL